MSNDPTMRSVPADAPNGAAGEQPPEELRARAEAAERERDEFVALLKGKQAEFENYQKRQRRLQEEAGRYAHADFALALLPILDNLERASTAARQAGVAESLVQGVALVESQFLDVLRRYGVTRMEALGRPFDPNLHEAVTQQPSAEHPPQTVVNVFAHGYLIHDRVLRPAQVAVSVAPA